MIWFPKNSECSKAQATHGVDWFLARHNSSEKGLVVTLILVIIEVFITYVFACALK